MARKKEKQKPDYKYETSDMEAKYKIFMNPDVKKREAIKARVVDNNGFCPNRTEKTQANRCICEQFMERDSEGWCKCHLFYKEARTAKQAEAYKNQEFEVNEKREKELAKQLDKEEAAAKKEPVDES